MQYDLGDIVGVLFVSAVSVLVSIGLFAITQDKTVTRYYVGESESSHDRGYLVMAERNWYDDDIAYVTDDINKAIDVTNKLNQTLGVK